MNLLLVNSNQYHYPPVIPLGLEYLSGAIKQSHHNADIVDLCFSSDPEADLVKKIESYNPDIIGITFRQIDTVLYHVNEYFVDDLYKLVSLCKKMGKKVILGGAGFSIAPNDILKYTGADYGVVGPGELALIEILNGIENNENMPSLFDGYNKINPKNFKRSKAFDYTPYLEKEGTIGFRTQIGCTEKCIFCTEGGKKVIFCKSELIIQELKELKANGFNHFHLCDSEFNLDLEFSINVCKEIALHVPDIKWSIYMKAFPYSKEYFEWLKNAGVDLITLSLNTAPGVLFERKKLEELFRLSHKNGIKVAVDLSTGFPYEKLDDVKAFIIFLSEQPIETAGVNYIYRIYKNTPLQALVSKNKDIQQCIIGTINDNANYLKPIFFRFFQEDDILSMIHHYKNFRLEGLEKRTNYQRV